MAETLDEAWAAALAADQGLAARRWDASSAEHTLRAARAQHWPVLAVEGSYNVQSAEPAFRFDLDGIPLSTNVFHFAQNEFGAFRTTIDVPLYTSGRIRHGIAAAAADLTSAMFSAEQFRMDVKMQVALEYVAVLRAQRDVEVAESSVRSLQAHARTVEELYRHEQVPKNDLLAAQVALSNARQEAIRANNRLDAARSAYNRRLGRDLTWPVRISELPVEPLDVDLETETAQALRARPDLAQYTARVDALQHQSERLLAGNRPQIAVRGEYSLEENRFRSPEGIAAVGVGVTWNLFDGGKNRYEAAAVRDHAEAVARAKADLESAIALQVRRAWLDVQETRRRLKATMDAVGQAEENLRVARKRYSLGAAISTEVLDAETLRIQAYRNHYDATYDAVLAALRLEYVAGRL